jgi:hypothetical protein
MIEGFLMHKPTLIVEENTRLSGTFQSGDLVHVRWLNQSGEIFLVKFVELRCVHCISLREKGFQEVTTFLIQDVVLSWDNR